MRTLPLLALCLLLGLTACGRRKAYPDTVPGWHSADYHTLFGRLQRVPAPNPDDPPAWAIRYGYASTDGYGGKFNLTPPKELVGYNGGELVEIHGVIRPELTKAEFPGTWYEIHAIRVWSGTQPQ